MTSSDKKFTTNVDEDLFKKFKAQVVLDDSTIKETIEMLMAEYLQKKGISIPKK